jgi:hypothetical protein
MKPLLLTLLTTLALSIHAQETTKATTENRAVSARNGTADFFLGRVDNETSGILSGSYTFPLATHFGVQFAGEYGQRDGNGIYGTDAHIFWRNPEYALAGLTGSYFQHRKNDLWRLGVEGELYIKQITLSGKLGNQSGDLGDDIYGTLGAHYYMIKDMLAISAEIGSFDDSTIWSGEGEYLTNLGGLSVMVFGGRDGNENYYILGGIRYYFGAKKSLLLRHRLDLLRR